MFKKFVSFFFEDEEVESEEVEAVKEEAPAYKPMADISLAPKVEETPSQTMEFYEVAEKPSRFIDLDEPVKEVKPAKRERKVEVEKKPDYEFTSVISPIFGVKEKEVVPTYKHSSPNHVVIEESVLGTVFSPMYGRAALTKKEPAKAEEKAVELPKREEQLPPLFELDELLSVDKPSFMEEDVHQMSLFELQSENQLEHSDNELSEFFDGEQN